MASVASNDDTLFLSTLEMLLLSMLGETMEKIVVSNSLLRYLFVLVWSYHELLLFIIRHDHELVCFIGFVLDLL